MDDLKDDVCFMSKKYSVKKKQSSILIPSRRHGQLRDNGNPVKLLAVII